MTRMPIPPVRPSLRIVPFQHEGKDVFLVDDHQECLFEHQIVLPPLVITAREYARSAARGSGE